MTVLPHHTSHHTTLQCLRSGTVMAIPWSTPSYSSQRHQRGEHRDTAQVQREKLDRASRLLLGAMIEAYDVLSQLQAELGCEVQQNENIPALRQFVQDINTHSQTISYLSQSPVNNTVPVVTSDKPVLAHTDITVQAAEKDQGESQGDCQGDGVISEPQQCVGDLSSLPDIVASIRSETTSLPALPDLIQHSNFNCKTPKISWRPKRSRPKFRIIKPVEVEKVRRSQSRPNISWKEAGTKLSELADHYSSTELSPEDRASRHVRQSDTDHLISNVFKCVQAVGLLLIMKKIDQMLK